MKSVLLTAYVQSLGCLMHAYTGSVAQGLFFKSVFRHDTHGDPLLINIGAALECQQFVIVLAYSGDKSVYNCSNHVATHRSLGVSARDLCYLLESTSDKKRWLPLIQVNKFSSSFAWRTPSVNRHAGRCLYSDVEDIWGAYS